MAKKPPPTSQCRDCKVYTTHHALRVMGIGAPAGVLLLVQQALYLLSHLPSPSFVFIFEESIELAWMLLLTVSQISPWPLPLCPWQR